MKTSNRTGLAPITVGVREAVRLSGLSRATIYIHLKSGRLASTRLGGKRLIYTASLQEFLGVVPELQSN